MILDGKGVVVLLLNFSVSNFLSFKNTQTLQLAVKSKNSEILKSNSIFSYEDNRKTRQVLNVAAIYGANASGKSNLLKAVKALQRIINYSHKFDGPDDYRFLKKFHFTSDNEQSMNFDITFIENKMHYQYTISFSPLDKSIIYERIIKRPIENNKLRKAQIVIEREHNTFIKFDKHLKNLVAEYKTQNFEFKSLVSLFVNSINKDYFKADRASDSFRDIKEVYDFITQKLAFFDHKKNESEISELLLKRPDVQEKLLLALSELDYSIVDFQVRDVTKKNNLLNLIQTIDDPDEDVDIAEVLQKAATTSVYELNPVHRYDKKSTEILPFADESHGTRKFINDFVTIYDALENGKTLFADELEAGYHSFVQKYILDLFLDAASSAAQLIFTTHSINFMSPEDFAKDQIWFVEKNRHTLDSELYSLAEFPDISSNNHNWGNMYLEGRLGAIPKVMV